MDGQGRVQLLEGLLELIGLQRVKGILFDELVVDNLRLEDHLLEVLADGADALARLLDRGLLERVATDRELQRQMANELGQQGIESSQELSRLRKENGEIRQKIEAIAKMKRETAMYHELHASGEWTALRIKTNKHIGEH